MSGGEGGQERTEKATPRKLKKARQDGALSRSQDLAAWMAIGGAAVMVPTTISRGSDAAREQLATVGRFIADPDPDRVVDALGAGLGSVMITLLPLLAVVVLAAFVAGATQGGGVRFVFKRIKPKGKNLNLVKGMKRLFGAQAWWQGAKAALKAGVIALVLFFTVQSMTPLIGAAGGLPLATLLDAAGSAGETLLRSAVVAGLALAALDVAIVMKRNRKQTKMTKKELKDEHKSTEGDPMLKGAIRARQLAMSRNRMMATIAGADVVLVNPTHVAVALRYQPGSGAPRVVAKGAGHVATRIRAKATEHRVPMVEDVLLARTLHAACEIGDEIPEHLYTAVARVLAFVMALRRRGSAAGMHRAPSGVMA